jgi:hypothetical protein
MVTSVVVWILFELQLKIHFFIFVMLCHFYFFLDLRFYFALRGCFHHDLVLLVCARVSHELSSFGFPVQSYFCCSDPSMSGLVFASTVVLRARAHFVSALRSGFHS